MSCPVCGREYVYGGGDSHAACRDEQDRRTHRDKALTDLIQWAGDPNPDRELPPIARALLAKLLAEINKTEPIDGSGT